MRPHSFPEILSERAEANRLGTFSVLHEGFDVDVHQHRFSVSRQNRVVFVGIADNATADHMRASANKVVAYFLSLKKDAQESN